MARRRTTAPRQTATGRRIANRARNDRGAAIASYVAAGGATIVTGMAGVTGNVPMAAMTGTVAAGLFANGGIRQNMARDRFARARAVDDLVGRARRANPVMRGDAGNDMLGGRRERSRYGQRAEKSGRSGKIVGATAGVIGTTAQFAGAAMQGVGFANLVTGNLVGGAGLMAFGNLVSSKGKSFAKAGFDVYRDGSRTKARGNAVDELIARSRGQGGIVSRIQSKAPPKPMRGSAGADRLAPPMPTVGVDGLAYTANTAATLAGSQLARSARKVARPATDQAVADAKTVAGAQKNRASRKAAVSAPSAPSTLSRVTGALAKANPLMMVTAGGVMGRNAFDLAKASGASDMQAAGAGAVAAAPMAAAAVAPTVIGRVAPKIAAGLSKAALPLLALSTAIAAARGGIKAAGEGKGLGGIAAGAAWGAADSLTFGLASRGADKVAEVGRAYLTDSARAKAQSTAAAPVDAPGRRPQAALPSTDGQTAGYTRIDPRTGAVVRVQGYKTPT